MQKKAEILIVGGDSTIGSTLVSYLEQTGVSVYATTRRLNTLRDNRIYLDLSKDLEEWILPDSIEIAIICAGITEVDACKKDPDGSARINVNAVLTLAKRFLSAGIHTLYLSSNQVFDGSILFPSIETPVSPISEYGRQKADVERQLLAQGSDNVTIVRLTKVMNSKNAFFKQWVQTLKAGEVIQPFSDMVISPVPLLTVIVVLRLLIDRRLSGIFQLSGDRDISYADAALTAIRILGAKPNQIRPVRSSALGVSSEPFPSRTALSNDRIKFELGIKPPETLWTIEQAFINPTILDGNIK